MTLSAPRKLLAAFMLGWLLVAPGCTPPPTPAAPTRLRLVATPSLAPLVDQLGWQYTAGRTDLRLETSEAGVEAALQAVAAGQADLALVERQPELAELLNPDDQRPFLAAWPIAADGLAVVVHPSNPVVTLTTEQLRQVFAGAERRWNNVGGPEATIQVVSREVGATAREVFDRKVLQGTRIVGAAVVMPNDKAVADYMAGHPAAIGYLSVAWAGEGVKILGVDGVLPGATSVAEGTYPLARPVLLVGRRGLPRKAKAFLDYAQSQEGQDVIARLYAPLS